MPYTAESSAYAQRLADVVADYPATRDQLHNDFASYKAQREADVAHNEAMCRARMDEREAQPAVAQTTLNNTR
jgi:hypothetical protein